MVKYTDPDENIIEGEIDTPETPTEIVKRAEPGALTSFNPLDAQPVAFKQALIARQENYDSLANHLRTVLVAGKDFGKIHVDKSCKDKWRCTNPRHFSGYELFAPGADKILGILNLGVRYPGVEDYKRAALKGMPLEDIITDCEILSSAEQVIAHGMGSCSRGEPTIKGRNLNATIKRACKRARVDAVKRLPSVSALFEDESFWAGIEDAGGKPNGLDTRNQRSRSNEFNTGAILTTMPIGKALKGKSFEQMDEGALEWILKNHQDKPDIYNAAKREHDKRSGATHTPPQSTAEGPAQDSAPERRQGQAAGAREQSSDDWLAEYDQMGGADSNR